MRGAFRRKLFEIGGKVAFLDSMIGEGGPEIAVILVDENGTIVDAHASCLETFGWEHGELLGKDVRELLQYGRDLLMSQLQVLEDDGSGHTSFSVRVLAKRKDNRQFPARATVRRFRELECWTVAFYKADSEPADADVAPAVSAEEIALAKRALEEGTAKPATKAKKQKNDVQKGDGMSVSRLWRNSRLLFSSREEKPSEMPAEGGAEESVDESIARDSASLAKQYAEATATEAAPPTQELPAAKTEPKPAAVTPAPLPLPPAPTPVTAPAQTASAAPTPKPVTSTLPKPPPAATVRAETHPAPADAVVSVARAKAELEKERGERSRIEQRCASLASQVQSLHLQLSESLNVERENASRVAELERDLRETHEALLQAKSDLNAEERERQSADEHITVLKGLNARLDETVRLTEGRAKAFESAQKETHDFLVRSQAALREAEAALDQERTLRQQAEQSLNNATRAQREHEEAAAAERSTLQSLLAIAELERSRSEEQLLRARAEALESTREDRARLNRFRHRFSEVLEHINGTTSELLQSSLSDEQKLVIESLLQDVLSLESTLEEEKADKDQPVAAAA